MRYISKVPVIRSLQARGLVFPIIAALAVIAALVHGALNRESPAEAAPRVAEEPAPPPFVRPDLEKGPLTYVSDYWLQLG